MVLASKQFNADGTLFNLGGGIFFGDVIHVNGEPWPFMNVEPRKYRFRFLDAAITRSFHLYFADNEFNTVPLPFQVISSDSGLLEHPVETESLHIAMAERYDVVFDFTQYAGLNIDLRNFPNPTTNSIGHDTNYDNTDKVMRFHVSEAAVEDNSVVPADLRDVPYPNPTGEIEEREFVFARTQTPAKWTINNVTFSEPQNRLLASPAVGTVERWKLINTNTGVSHPIHIHLVDFRVISRESIAGNTQASNRQVVEEYETGLKDVVWLGRGENVTVEAHYAPFPGLYMFHCHNLQHEDSDMMAAFNATVLPDYGYNATLFVDPMEPIWQPRAFQANEFTGSSGAFSESAIIDRLHEMAEYRPYQAADDQAEE
jgi:bilirubin oxidase